MFTARTPIQDLLYYKGRFIVFTELNEEQKQLLGAPQFQPRQIVTVINPWWWKSGAGVQVKDRIRCVIEAAPPYWHARGDGGGYSVDVREADNPGAHGRSVQESDIEGFVPNPFYPPS